LPYSDGGQHRHGRKPPRPWQRWSAPLVSRTLP